MKIGIDISQTAYFGTGVAAYTRLLVASLLEIDRNNQYVLFAGSWRRRGVLTKYLKSLPTNANFHPAVLPLPPTALDLIWNKLHIVGVERFVGKVDIFHTSDWTEPPAKAKKVTTIHDMLVYKYPEYLNRRIVETQKRKLAWVKKEAAAILTDSVATKLDVIKYLKIPEEKIHVVYLGVAINYYPRPKDEVARVKLKYGITGEYILAVGTREPRKNLDRIKTSFGKLKLKDYTLAISGAYGWGKDIMPDDNVKLLGYVDETDLPAIYTGATGFIYPSLYEGFGLPVLEAMACGVPVVTANSGSLAEITGDLAITVDPEAETDIAVGIDKVINLSAAKRTEISDAGRKHAGRFTWKKTAEQTLKVYNSVLI